MSILTKIFVVLVTVLSIALVAMIVPFVANTQNYQDAMDDLRQQLRTAEAEAQAARRDREQAAARQAQLVSENEEEVARLRDDVGSLTERLSEAQAKLRAEQQRNVEIVADIKRLASAYQTAVELNEAQNRELAALRTERERLQTEMVQLGDQVNELQGTTASLNRQIRTMEQARQALQDEYEELQEIWGRVPARIKQTILDAGAGPEGSWTPRLVRGQVTAVQGGLIELNVGENDGVGPNTLFVISRNGEYVARAVTTGRVNPDASVAEVRSAVGTVMEGDVVLSGPELAATGS